MRGRLFSTSPTNFAFGAPFVPKGAWRAACVEPQGKIESPFCISELEGIRARQGLLLAVTTALPEGRVAPSWVQPPTAGS